MKNNTILKTLLKFFLQGVLFLGPVALTVYVIYKTVQFFDNLLPFIQIPGLSLLIVLSGITLFGFLASTIIVGPMVDLFEDIIMKIPGLKLIYSPIKEFLSAIVGDKGKFKEPVLVNIYEGASVYKLGFITSRDLSILGMGEDMIAVYMPHSYNFSGNLFFVPARLVKPIDASSSDVMKFVVTAGVTEINK